MGRFQFELAQPADDAELRAILASTPMAGQISISFRREPSFFAAAVGGDFHQVVVCRDRQENRIAGFGCRSVGRMHVNGQPLPVGYLSGLRALPEYRSLGLLARGYAFFKRLHEDGRAAFYVTTIADGNERALATLTSARAGLPNYVFTGDFHTLVVPVARARQGSRSRQSVNSDKIQTRHATLDDRTEIIDFLRRVGPMRQFFPEYDGEELFCDAGTFRNLAANDLLLAFCDGRLVGTLGCWNQLAFRQSVVERYDMRLRWSRPLINAWARCRGLPRLPPIGQPFPYLTGALPVVEGNDPDAFRGLLDAARVHAANGPCDYLLLGLHESDPLWPIARAYQSGAFVTKTYIVGWEGIDFLQKKLDRRPLYLELGCL